MKAAALIAALLSGSRAIFGILEKCLNIPQRHVLLYAMFLWSAIVCGQKKIVPDSRYVYTSKKTLAAFVKA